MQTCPKCGYVRKPGETAPDWQCPSCGIAYEKFHAATPAAQHAAAVRVAEGGEAATGTSYDTPLVHAVSIGLALAVSWAVYMFTEESLVQYRHFGWISGIDLMRVLAVAFDIYVAGSFVNGLLDALARPLKENHHRFAFAVGCIALAFALHYTGTLAKAYAALGLKPPGAPASVGSLRAYRVQDQAPELPLEAFAGDWYGVSHKRMPNSPLAGPGSISRLYVSVENGEARVHIWRSCPPRQCDSGSYPAIVQSRRRGTAVALHVAATTDGTDWLVTLLPQRDFMMLEEQRLRGTDGRNKRGFSDWMVRANDPRLK